SAAVPERYGNCSGRGRTDHRVGAEEAGRCVSLGWGLHRTDSQGRQASGLTWPIQQSTKLQLMVNLRVAKALKLTIPQAILVRADEVIGISPASVHVSCCICSGSM